MSAREPTDERVPMSAYYSTYFGHDARHLEPLHASLRRGGRRAIFLAGDSSLDNKEWIQERADATNGYEHVLDPPQQKLDVTYWLNRECVARGRTDLFALNTAVKATRLEDRSCLRLLSCARTPPLLASATGP